MWSSFDGVCWAPMESMLVSELILLLHPDLTPFDSLLLTALKWQTTPPSRRFEGGLGRLYSTNSRNTPLTPRSWCNYECRLRNSEEHAVPCVQKLEVDLNGVFEKAKGVVSPALIESTKCSPLLLIASTSTHHSILNMYTSVCTSPTPLAMMYTDIVMTTGVSLPNSAAQYVSDTSVLSSTLTTTMIGIRYSSHSIPAHPARS